MTITAKQKRSHAHFSMIHHCLCVLPLDSVRLLYKYILAVFVQKAKKAQKSASNVGADLPTEVMDRTQYVKTLNNLGNAWERANEKSAAAFHHLRLLDDATVTGKMRAGVSKYAYGSFEHCIAALSGESCAVGGPDFDSPIALTRMKKSAEEKEVVPELLDGVPTERMGTYVSPSLPVEVEDTEPVLSPITDSEPVRVANYLVF